MDWTDDQRELRGTLGRWGERFSVGHQERDRNSQFSRTTWDLVMESGILRLPFPSRYGGLEKDLCTTMFVLEELGRTCHDGGLNFVISTQLVSAGVPLLRFGSDAQRDRYLPGIAHGRLICAHAISEPQSGSDAFAMSTTAVRDGTDYVFNGSKTFITNGPIADVVVVYAMTDRRRGALGGCSAFLVERGTPGFEVGPEMEKMGLRSAPLCELYFSDCRVPKDNLIGKEGLGFPVLDHTMKWEVLCSFIITVGEMQRRLDQCVAYAKDRRQFNTPIGAYQSVAHELVDMRIGVEVSREWLYRAGRRVQRGENASVDIAIGKLLASEHGLRSATQAVQLFGGNGYMVEYGLERQLRNAVAGTIYSGTSNIQRNRIAALMGLPQGAHIEAREEA
jgi:alkylation response protein AidB-like acyl-CoA dehydrogenase